MVNHSSVATLPECGFEWNMNDIILSMNGMSNWMAVLQLLIVMSVGAQIIINVNNNHDSCMCLNRFAKLVNQYNVSTCLMASRYLIDLIKLPKIIEMNSLMKILHFEQPFHQNIIKDIQNRFERIQTCRFIPCKNDFGNYPFPIKLKQTFYRFLGMEWFCHNSTDESIDVIIILHGTMANGSGKNY